MMLPNEQPISYDEIRAALIPFLNYTTIVEVLNREIVVAYYIGNVVTYNFSEKMLKLYGIVRQ